MPSMNSEAGKDDLMRDTIRIRISLAILLIDDFTGKIMIEPSFRIAVRGAGKPIRKSDGFWIFTNLTEPEAQVSIIGPCYQSEYIRLDLTTLDSANPVVRIRMKPDKTYRLLKGTTCMAGFLPDGAALMVFCEQGNDYKKLLVDYEQGSAEISLYQGGNEEMEGKLCCIADKDKKKEIIKLGRMTDREKGLYQLAQPPLREYKKIGTKIYPVSLAQAREDGGEYFLPLSGNGQDRLEYTCIYDVGGSKTEERVMLDSGRVNRIDWETRKKR